MSPRLRLIFVTVVVAQIAPIPFGDALAMPPVSTEAKLRKRWRFQLVDALARRSPVALARAARHLGPGRLLHALGDPGDRPFRRAAIAAAPDTARPWTLLRTLIHLAAGPDRAEAIAAAQAARRIADDLRPALLQRAGESPATLAPIVSTLFARARDPRISLDLRVVALLTAAALRGITPLDPHQVKHALTSKEPALRRAAIELCAGIRAPTSLLLSRLKEEQDAAVLRAAAAAYCAQIPRSKRRARNQRRALKKAAILPILRAAARDRDASRDELMDIGRCLRLFGDPPNRHAYRTLRRRIAR